MKWLPLKKKGGLKGEARTKWPFPARWPKMAAAPLCSQDGLGRHEATKLTGLGYDTKWLPPRPVLDTGAPPSKEQASPKGANWGNYKRHPLGPHQPPKPPAPYNIVPVILSSPNTAGGNQNGGKTLPPANNHPPTCARQACWLPPAKMPPIRCRGLEGREGSCALPPPKAAAAAADLPLLPDSRRRNAANAPPLLLGVAPGFRISR